MVTVKWHTLDSPDDFYDEKVLAECERKSLSF
jgi:hypothetical protein